MMITLMCSKNPWSLGITENNHSINMDKLYEHVEGCKICRQYYNENIFRTINRILVEENKDYNPKSLQGFSSHGKISSGYHMEKLR